EEIALLEAIFKYDGRLIIEVARGKNRQDPSIGIRERLPRAEDVEKPQRHSRDVVGTPNHEAHTLLVIFGQGINRGQGRGFTFGCWQRLEHVALKVADLPEGGAQLCQRTLSPST